MRLLPVLLLGTLLPGGAFSAEPAPRELRGLWVVRTALVSPAEVDRVVEEARSGGFNALFVQVRGRGDAFYESRLAPRSPIIPAQQAGFDPFARLLERARASGLEVHAWVNVLLSAHFSQPLPPGHVLLQHPEWLMIPRGAAAAASRTTPEGWMRLVLQAARSENDVEGYYLSPSAPGVGEHLEAVVRELLRTYAVTGLHLDFVRYPSPDYDYGPAALEAFRRLRGGGDLLGNPARYPGAWDDYRRSAVTVLASRLAKAARAERPGLVVSAAVAADEYQAVSEKYQAWPQWLAERLLDAVCPMAYTADSRIFLQQVQQARTRVQEGQRLWAGIGAYRLDVAGIVEKVRLAREAGAAGVVLFSHESLAPADLKRLHDEAFPATTVIASDRRAVGGSAAAR
jgi:uncharacterized lipoprotein YddW (UPF0748 family)